MAGLGVRVYTDEMITPRLAEVLRHRGYDVTSTQREGRAGKKIPDSDQLAYATADGRAIYTFNVQDFLQLDARWHSAARAHVGIIFSEDLNTTLDEMANRLQQHLDTVAPSLQHDHALELCGRGGAIPRPPLRSRP